MSTTGLQLIANKPTYRRLPEVFYARVDPTPVSAPELLALNRPLARQLGLDADALTDPEAVAVLAGNRSPVGSEPLALAYAGHQFGAFVPKLGDGRAVLLGEIMGRDGARRDVQLKGAGKTPYSRRGDGRAPLGPVVREYLAGEAMAGLGIPTTRALAAVTTGETVFRPHPEPGAVLVRVASSHIRIGTFEYAAQRGEGAVRLLADYVISRHAPDLADAGHPYRALLDHIATLTAELVASWMLVGFIHGVMNTDNISVAGETIDYGPFAFMDRYHPRTVFSSIDTGGRYAFNQQPRIAAWNLARLAETMLPLLGDRQDDAVSAAESSLERFADRFQTRYDAGLGQKIGLSEQRAGDAELAAALLAEMARAGADYTLAFRRLSNLSHEPSPADDGFRALFDSAPELEAWLSSWRERLGAETRRDDERRAAMRAVNPAFVLRTHLADGAATAAARGDRKPMDDLLAVLSDPFSDHPELGDYGRPPAPNEAITRTFCGT